jgi:Xaa-Pro aminopeptidase
MLDPKYCAQRLQKFAGLCSERGLDAAVIADRKNVYYFTGYLRPALAWMEPRMELLLVFPASGSVVVISKTFAEEVKLRYQGEILVYKDYDIHDKTATSAEDVAAALLAYLPGKAPLQKIGIESRYLPVTLENALQTACENAELVDISTLVPEMRKRKDPDELRLLKLGMALHKEGYAVARKCAGRGKTEVDVYAAVTEALCRKYGEYLFFGGDFVSGERALKVGGPPTRRVLKQGELLILDFWVMAHGYWVDTARTIVIGGKPNREQQRIHKLVLKAVAAGEKVLRPGNRACDVYAAVRAVFEKEGLAENFPVHAGHGIGLHPHEFPLLIPGSTETLEEGMVATLEPGLYIGGFGGVRVEENYLITARGPQKLTNFPRGL